MAATPDPAGTMTSESAPTSSSGRRRIVRALGIVLALVALGFCFLALYRDGDEVLDSLHDANPVLIGLGVVLSFGSMGWLAVLWHRCLRALGAPVRVADVLGWYFTGELGKYVPGGVWQVVGRSELAHQHGRVGRRPAYASTLLAYAVMCLGAFVVCGVASPWLALGEHGSPWAWCLAVGAVSVPVVTHPRVLGLVLSVASRLTRRRAELEPLPWVTMLGLVAWSLPAWAMLGAASSALALALGHDEHVVRVAVAAVAAWLIGFLAVPVPAGAGIREVVFATFSGMATGPAVAVALASRVVLILVDAVGGLVSIVWRRVHDSRRDVV